MNSHQRLKKQVAEMNKVKKAYNKGKKMAKKLGRKISKGVKDTITTVKGGKVYKYKLQKKDCKKLKSKVMTPYQKFVKSHFADEYASNGENFAKATRAVAKAWQKAKK